MHFYFILFLNVCLLMGDIKKKEKLITILKESTVRIRPIENLSNEGYLGLKIAIKYMRCYF